MSFTIREITYKRFACKKDIKNFVSKKLYTMSKNADKRTLKWESKEIMHKFVV